MKPFKLPPKRKVYTKRNSYDNSSQSSATSQPPTPKEPQGYFARFYEYLKSILSERKEAFDHFFDSTDSDVSTAKKWPKFNSIWEEFVYKFRYDWELTQKLRTFVRTGKVDFDPPINQMPVTVDSKSTAAFLSSTPPPPSSMATQVDNLTGITKIISDTETLKQLHNLDKLL
ncbi:hypothetical protein BLA29_010902 [Euroglyphus maynei]|uniref:Uncharacterized protein n=1 Tax=Euroglyphus maynei TaxID=6958 RepID=A0A1Y3AT62_EURMA|nr:hypothetical protein BLA29_010902 [Euroglyphus maynei]